MPGHLAQFECRHRLRKIFLDTRRRLMFLSRPCSPRPTPLIHPPSPAARRGSSSLVRKLIDYGKELAATIRRRAFTDPGPVISRFGIADVAQILARISRGLHRANALEARLLRNADRLDAAPRDPSSPGMQRAPRQATAPSADEANARLTYLPTPQQIADKIRRQPIGAVIADICRDLGILPSDPLWRELQAVIIREGGSLAKPDERHPRPGVSDRSHRASRIANTAPAITWTCPHRPVLNPSSPTRGTGRPRQSGVLRLLGQLQGVRGEIRQSNLHRHRDTTSARRGCTRPASRHRPAYQRESGTTTRNAIRASPNRMGPACSNTMCESFSRL